MEDQVVLILPANSNDRSNNTKQKLFNLYKEHTLISNKIIEIQKYVSIAIDENDGLKLENYSLKEREYIHKFLNLKMIIASYERNFFVSSVELERHRTLAAEQENLIKRKGKNNRNTLRSSLLNISSQIECFTQKILYTPQHTRQAAPIFVDISI